MLLQVGKEGLGYGTAVVRNIHSNPQQLVNPNDGIPKVQLKRLSKSSHVVAESLSVLLPGEVLYCQRHQTQALFLAESAILLFGAISLQKMQPLKFLGAVV